MQSSGISMILSIFYIWWNNNI